MKIDQPIINYTTEYEILRMFFKDYTKAINFVDNRKRENIIVKHAFCVAATKMTSLSLATIGSIINKDHATVLHAKRKHDENLRFLSNYKNVYNNIHKSLSLNLSYGKDFEDAEEVSEIKELRSRLVDISQKLRNTIIEANELSYKNEILIKHNKSLQERNDKLNKELARVKNLL
jgi:hypothetical protein